MHEIIRMFKLNFVSIIIHTDNLTTKVQYSHTVHVNGNAQVEV